ncbi:MAG: hypothetical protein WKG00_12930 [Polyangiaceae bacterium]
MTRATVRTLRALLWHTPRNAGTFGRRPGAPDVRHYRGDVSYFVGASPYLSLAKLDRAVAFLGRQIEVAEDCLPGLAAYPGVLVEPLEFFYTTLRSLGALDLAFFEGMMSDHTWRGVVWGAWLALIEPSELFQPALVGVRGRWPHNEWLVDCALATVRQDPPAAEHRAFVALAARCKNILSDVPRPPVRLRREPSEAQLARMELERAVIRAAYARGGSEAARAALADTLVGFYAQDHATWARRCPT